MGVKDQGGDSGTEGERSEAQRGAAGAVRGAAEATATKVSTESAGGGGGHRTCQAVKNDGPGGEYRVGGTDTEESATDSNEWSKEEVEELESEGGTRPQGGQGR